MFFSGSLQEGISKAVEQQKLVLCFVTDDGEESQLWENDYLKDDALHTLVETQSVALRLTAGTEEAGYLAQIIPLPKTPTVVLMKHGELKEYIASGTIKEEFTRRVQNAFSRVPQPASNTTDATTNNASVANNPSSPAPTAAAATTSAGLSSSSPTAVNSSTPATANNPSTHSSDDVSRVLAERAARLEAARQEAHRISQEEKRQAQKKAKAEAAAGMDTKAARVQKEADAAKKRKQDMLDERKRILQNIEQDKMERKMRAAQRELQRQEDQKARQGEGEDEDVDAMPQSQIPPSRARQSQFASVQVRLSDGSSIRERFEADTATLSQDVRAWIDSERTDGKSPYRFKHILTPLPNRNIDDTEEDKSLRELGLAPSSTLLLTPVRNAHFDAQGAAGGPDILSQLIITVMGFFTWLLQLVGLGTRQSPVSQSQTSQISVNPETSASASAREEAQAARRRQQQLYNGNSTNFESRPEDVETTR